METGSRWTLAVATLAGATALDDIPTCRHAADGVVPASWSAAEMMALCGFDCRSSGWCPREGRRDPLDVATTLVSKRTAPAPWRSLPSLPTAGPIRAGSRHRTRNRKARKRTRLHRRVCAGGGDGRVPIASAGPHAHDARATRCDLHPR
jgi:hypothetical protein